MCTSDNNNNNNISRLIGGGGGDSCACARACTCARTARRFRVKYHAAIGRPAATKTRTREPNERSKETAETGRTARGFFENWQTSSVRSGVRGGGPVAYLQTSNRLLRVPRQNRTPALPRGISSVGIISRFEIPIGKTVQHGRIGIKTACFFFFFSIYPFSQTV